jgi:glycyl-tRNA synthetase beta chain
MPDLLLELLTEEIPARMQAAAAKNLRALAEIKLKAAGLAFTKLDSFVTPRRLVLAVTGLPAGTQATSEERRGPRVGAPPQAVEGFLKSAGLTSLEQCEKRAGDKGEFYFAIIKRAGQETKSVLPDLLRAAMLELPWPKSMRFPAAGFRWVRPLVSVMALFDGKVLPLALDSVPVGDKTLGHRFLSDGAIAVKDFADYRAKLKSAKVMLDPAERRAAIASSLAEAAGNAGLTIKPDEGLLDEVGGLVEWPVVLMGSIGAAFMDLPPEVLTTAMRTHQKYFAALDKSGKLAPHFFVVANMVAADGGKAIIAGNERVLRARLSDARFFWDQDRKVKLAARVPKLKERVFHAKLGTMHDKVERVMKLAAALAPSIKGADATQACRAAQLAKADLSSGMVGEFPELQGIMGRYYALADGEPKDVAEAIAEHYSPLGPNDRCPTAPVSVAVALADKLDTLAGFFAVNELPTGSKDPFALRRAALGIIRLILENNLRLKLIPIFRQAAAGKGDPSQALLDFFADRLKVALKEKGTRHDLVAAVFALGGEDDLVRLLARVEALGEFLKSEAGVNLLAAYKRAANILRIEEKKDSTTYSGVPRPDLLVAAEERALDKALGAATTKSGAALKAEDFAGAMAALASLRGPVDAFFAKVTVNDPDKELRQNRLRLLSQIRDTLNLVADFAQIEG